MSDISTTLENPDPENISEDTWSDICSELLDVIRDMSPVDTGNFQNGWDMKAVGDNMVELFNPVEYSSFLEDGHSGQAPNGVLGQALKQLPSIIRQNKSSAKSPSEFFKKVR